MVAGVYQILNRVTGDKYIGGSASADKTIKTLANLLSSLSRPQELAPEFSLNSTLSLDWFKHGQDKFSLTVIEQLSRDRALISTRKLFWCRLLQPTYNDTKYEPIISGIYQIINVQTGYSYIGQSRDIYYRWGQHKSHLRCKRHNNKYLQESFDRWGQENFELRVLEVCFPNSKTLTSLEKDWIKRSMKLFKVPVKWKGHKQVMTLGGTQSMATLYEPGLYHLMSLVPTKISEAIVYDP